MNIVENLERVRENIEAACARRGRSPSEVTLIAVSKTHPPEVVLAALAAGVQHFGENRVEEAEQKVAAVHALAMSPLTWHMVGHLQSRKAKDAILLFNVIHSVDTPKLAEKLSRLAVEAGRQIDVLLEINITGEESKYGIAAAGWERNPEVRKRVFEIIHQTAAMPGLRLRGLMTMAPVVEAMEAARPTFSGLARLKDAVQTALHVSLPDLSMGMTDDYSVAVEEGATLVRIGRAIFGERL
jgi:hypothetical protein